MTTHCYHTTPSGHKVNLTLHGTDGPVLITFHGGGIVNGSRRDDHVPKPVRGVSIPCLSSAFPVRNTDGVQSLSSR